MIISKPKCFSKNLQKIADFELRTPQAFLRRPRFPAPMSFSGARLNIEIYTDACERSPIATDVSNWEPVVGIGGILVVSGK